MPTLVNPPVASYVAGRPFIQTIETTGVGIEPARVVWMCPVDLTQGAVQICDIRVSPDAGRRGVGHALLDDAISQARQLFASQSLPLRRVWIMVAQKTDMTARSFMTQEGFHHIGTISNVLSKQDGLIYSKGLD